MFFRREARLGRCTCRPNRAVLDPRREISQHVVRQLTVRRHLQLASTVAHRLQQHAPIGIAGLQRRTIFAALEQRLTRIDAQIVARLRPTVTLEAGLCEHRPYLRLEERLVRRLAERDRGRDEQQHGERKTHHPSIVPRRAGQTNLESEVLPQKETESMVRVTQQRGSPQSGQWGWLSWPDAATVFGSRAVSPG
jgi:hypothetical protein